MQDEMEDFNKLELKSCSSGSENNHQKMEVDKSKKGSI